MSAIDRARKAKERASRSANETADECESMIIKAAVATGGAAAVGFACWLSMNWNTLTLTLLYLGLILVGILVITIVVRNIRR